MMASDIMDEPKGSYFYERKRHQLQKKLCKYFLPYDQYFQTSPWCYLVKPSPTSFDSLTKYHRRNNLLLNKQMMYARNVIDTDFCQQVVKEFIKEDRMLPGALRKRGNCSCICNGVLYYAWECRIYQIQIAGIIESKDCQEQQAIPDIITQLARQEVAILQGIIYEMTVIGSELMIRLTREIVFFSLLTRNISFRHMFQRQIIATSVGNSPDNQPFVYISTYNAPITELFLLSGHSLFRITSINSFVNSHWEISQDTILICEATSFSLYDTRTSLMENLYQCKSKKPERIYNSLSLSGNYSRQPYVAATRSQSVALFDLRRCDSAFLSMPHHCEQNPPTVLQFYDGKKFEDTLSTFGTHMTSCLQHLQSLRKRQPNTLKEEPLLLTHSPHPLGSSLIATLNFKECSTHHNKTPFNRFQLLFDSGKVTTGCHPNSVSIASKGKDIILFHVDNYAGVAVQIMTKHNSRSPEQKQFSYQRKPFVYSQASHQAINCTQQWIKQQLLNKYIEKQDNSQCTTMIPQEDSELKLQQVDIESRKIRYADMKEFYHALQQQTQNLNLEKMILEESLQPKPAEYANKATADSSQSMQSSIEQTSLDPYVCSNALLQKLVAEWSV